MANEIQKRQIAYKLCVNDIKTGSYVREEGWTPNYILTKNGVKASRINLFGTVINVPVDNGGTLSITIDDGTGTIVLRSFEKNEIFNEINLGDIVTIVGRLRNYGEEIYILPEIIKKVEDNKWIEVRKLEINIKNKKTADPEKEFEEETIVEEIKTENPSNNIYKAVKELDNGDGADTEEVVRRCGENSEKMIDKMLMDGELFESKPGKIKAL